MEFADPAYGWIAVLAVIVFLLALRSERCRQEDLRRLAEPKLLNRLAPNEPTSWRWRRLLLQLFGTLFLVAALMRPQWGVVEEVHSVVGLDIVVALDVSRSMLADDLSPNRLAVAKKSVARLLDTAAGDRIGLLAFAGSAFLVCPLTTDYAICRQMLDELSPDSIPKGGSSIAAALVEAERAFRGTPPGGRVLILVSDGEDHSGEIAPALDLLRRSGVTIIAALAGTTDGGLIPLPGGTFVKNRGGAVVKSHAHLAELQKLTTHTVELDAAGSALQPVLVTVRAGSHESDHRQKRQKLADRFQYPLAASLFLFALQLLPNRWRKR